MTPLLLLLVTQAHAKRQGNLWDFVRTKRSAKGEELDGQPEEPVEEEDVVVASAEVEVPEVESQFTEYEPSVNEAFYRAPVETLGNDPLHLASIDPEEFDIPLVVNGEVKMWMEYFLGRGRKWFSVWLSRSTAYREMMVEKLEAGGLPHDLVYLSMIESGYSTHAYSSAAAVGLWQFIAPTGREYGLRVDSWIDERRDPERSTDAAIQFLQHLYAYYGDWYLAWSGYNAGPGKVNKAIKRTSSKDFWVLAKSPHLRPETKNYVPKLLAAAIIGKHPERYGFVDIEYQEPLDYETVTVEHAFDLEVLAESAEMDLEDFMKLNPHVRQKILPSGGTIVHVTKNSKGFEKALASVPANERVRSVEHRVAKGETLGIIASRYGTSVAAIQKVNGIANPNLVSVGATLHIPKNGTVVAQAAQTTQTTRPSSHKVRSGETLGGIASRYGLSTDQLKRWNKLSNSNHIRVGQSLTLRGGTTTTTYVVKGGDTLTAIAARNRCSVAELRHWNGLKKSTIYPGQKLKVQN